MIISLIVFPWTDQLTAPQNNPIDRGGKMMKPLICFTRLFTTICMTSLQSSTRRTIREFYALHNLTVQTFSCCSEWVRMLWEIAGNSEPISLIWSKLAKTIYHHTKALIWAQFLTWPPRHSCALTPNKSPAGELIWNPNWNGALSVFKY